MVCNDIAENEIKLIQDFNLCLTKDEKWETFLLKDVSQCRKTFQGFCKATLSKPLPSYCDNYRIL